MKIQFMLEENDEFEDFELEKRARWIEGREGYWYEGCGWFGGYDIYEVEVENLDEIRIYNTSSRTVYIAEDTEENYVCVWRPDENE